MSKKTYSDNIKKPRCHNCKFAGQQFKIGKLTHLHCEEPIKYNKETFERSYRYSKYGYGLCRESKARLIESLQGQSTENLSMDLYFGWD